MFTDFPEIIVTACQFACIQRYPRNPRYRLQVSLHVYRDFTEILVTAYKSVCMLTDDFPEILVTDRQFAC